MPLRRSSSLLLATALAAGCQSKPVSPYPNSDIPGPRPLFKESVAQIGDDLSELHAREPNLQNRMVELARRNIGQPYELYLLGEAPFETIDDQPVYSLRKSDCVVFVEHTIAMALSDRFSEFLRILQRIRYKNGEIGVLTRNHYTEADWDMNNSWLARDITDELIGDKAAHFVAKTDRAKFFKERYHIATTMPVERLTVSYVPYEQLEVIKPKLKNGDIIQFVKGTAADDAWIHHFGLIAVKPDGTVDVIESNVPRVREETLDQFVAHATKDNAELDAKKKPRHRGFKILRLVDDPIAALKKIDGDAFPRVTVPASTPITFDAFVDKVMAGHG